MKPLLSLGLFFLAGCIARANPSQAPEWPLEIEDSSTHIVLYQPQAEWLRGDKLSSRAAVSVQRKSDPDPVFGAIWIEARVATDRDARTVTVLEVKLLDSKFPGTTLEQQSALVRVIQDELGNQHHTFSLDRLLGTLDEAVKLGGAAPDLQHAPPRILLATEPTVLVPIDGAPKLQAIPGSSLMSVVNTPFVVLFDLAHKTYYLQAGQRWMKAERIEGPWTDETRPPAEVTGALPPRTLAANAPAAEGPARILVATEPTELIVCSGAPTWTPLPENELLYLSNSENDVFLEVASQRLYVLLAGRWYSAASLEKGPWTYVASDALPQAFGRIPPDSAKGSVRTFVADTDEARDSLLDAAIPQTSVVKRSEAHCTVTYDGEPRFEPIVGTQMRYAANTGSSVLECAGRFYCCNEAVWFVADAALGPWSVCTQVPSEVYTIPPSCPVYPVRYVYVYDSTPEYLYAGYLPGYVGCYSAGPTIVYGTGYWYPGWYGSVYYPRPWTYGFHPHYHDWNGGWSLGFGFGWGSYPGWFGLSYGWGSPGWWGPGGFDGDEYELHGHTLHEHSNGAAAFDPDMEQQSHGHANIYNRSENAGRNRDVAALAQSTLARVSSQQQNDVYVDRAGRVLRRTNDGWQERAASGWKPAQSSAPIARPAPDPRPVRPSGPAQRDELEGMRAARERGDARAQARDKARPQPQRPQRPAQPPPRPPQPQRPPPKGDGRPRG